MDITRLRPEDTAAVDELWDMWRVARKHDCPEFQRPFSKAIFLADLNEINPEERHEWRVARIDGRIVGSVHIGMFLGDNEHLLSTDISVHPGFRRRGVGTALLDAATRAGREAGRTVLSAAAAEPLPGGLARTTDGRDFLLHHGFKVGNTVRSRILELSSIEGAVERELLDESWPKAEGYELVQWTGATPSEHAAGAAALASRLVSDVPFGDLDIEEVTYDTDRYLRKESIEMRRGFDFACTYVKHVASEELVAHSVISVNSEAPQYGGQWITLVHPDHRGHRLGMIVKIENHRLLRRTHPGVRWIETANAEVNSHMVAINERLGFTELFRHLDFQREI
ncbi:GNAT family N-acetyltransferase [Stackebrandtia nassauensis]|uniref:GCN5-related N-acetyltransferase n=1 Tax=Stackebrandtia nassauensis (strain DSM 44728 / CIP 108903 / NRRL B-16338 / NBRC 102104 / LLR-40K-21) TaxID=446470 RepID=D3Q1F4_STANL|nr:GNAT family N-acetyltransferase [Stackebrandtia nassauensis]ADD45734.1 GCN5-related N-acetyltransferase [Stackebrandtia nassauensis DSM 44728]